MTYQRNNSKVILEATHKLKLKNDLLSRFVLGEEEDKKNLEDEYIRFFNKNENPNKSSDIKRESNQNVNYNRTSSRLSNVNIHDDSHDIEIQNDKLIQTNTISNNNEDQSIHNDKLIKGTDKSNDDLKIPSNLKNSMIKEDDTQVKKKKSILFNTNKSVNMNDLNNETSQYDIRYDNEHQIQEEEYSKRHNSIQKSGSLIRHVSVFIFK